MTQSSNEHQFPDLQQILDRMPVEQLTLLILAAATWIIGGNIVVWACYRRRGIPYWKLFIPFHFWPSRLEAIDWIRLGVLAVVSLAMGALAIQLGP